MSQAHLIAIIALSAALGLSVPMSGAEEVGTNKTRICVDSVGHEATCTPEIEPVFPYDDTGVHHQPECRVSVGFGRCPSDPLCRERQGQQTQCVGKVMFATARCGDKSVTASKAPDEACRDHRGVSKRF